MLPASNTRGCGDLMKARIAQVLLLSAAIVQAGAIAPMHAIRSQTSKGVPPREAASPASLSAGERNGRVEGGGFRLPTEPEWEYAARGGGEGAFGLPCHDYIRRTCQDHPACLDEFAWYAANSDGKSHPAGQKKPNAWGLRDMHGNVWEWCEGWYGRYPDTFDKTVEWAGPEGGKTRVLRGGAWNSLPGSVRAAVRDFTAPSTRSKVIGFRCVKDS